MSIEALYPSRRQPRSANPLFMRARRRTQKIALIAVLGSFAGLVSLALLPAPPSGLTEGRSAAIAVAPAADTPSAASQKPVRIIPL